MSVWSALGKVAVGVAAGVGAVALAPVFGPIGVVTAVGAAVGAGVGAAAGGVCAAVGDGDDGRAERAEAQAAEQTARAEKMREEMERVKPHCQEMKNLHEYIVAAFAVAVCTASCDGEIHAAERLEIDEFIAGITANMLPSSVTEAIDRLYANPPSISQAIRYVQPFAQPHWNEVDADSGVITAHMQPAAPVSWQHFEDIIEMVVHADGVVHPNEGAFLEAWARAARDIGQISRFEPAYQAASA